MMQRKSLNFDEYFQGIVNVIKESDGPAEVVDDLLEEERRLSYVHRYSAPEIWNDQKSTIFKVLMALVKPFEVENEKPVQKWQMDLQGFLQQNC